MHLVPQPQMPRPHPPLKYPSTIGHEARTKSSLPRCYPNCAKRQAPCSQRVAMLALLLSGHSASVIGLRGRSLEAGLVGAADQNAMTEGDVPDGYGGAENNVMLAVEIPLIVLAIFTVVLRGYSRMGIKRRLAADDVLIILGTICAFGRTVISCLSADDTWGFDIKGPDQPYEIPYYQHIFERRIAYIFAVSFTRLSIIAYYLRIFPPSLVSLRRLCWLLLLLTLCQFTEVFTVLTVFCRGISKLWTSNYRSYSGSQCFSSSTYSYSAAIGDSILDCLIFALPIPYVWSLSKLRARQRFGLIVIFALGFTVCVVALLQIPFIRRREDNTQYFGGTINLLIAIQVSLAIITASLPDLRALIARSRLNFSPLHHRSLATAATNGDGDVERGRSMRIAEGVEAPRPAFEQGKRRFMPDWMREELPGSLMESRITMNELTRNELTRAETADFNQRMRRESIME